MNYARAKWTPSRKGADGVRPPRRLFAGIYGIRRAKAPLPRCETGTAARLCAIFKEVYSSRIAELLPDFRLPHGFRR